LTSIFDKVLRYDRASFPSAVLVTGPQRAGTRIAAKMVAADIGHTYYDETTIGINKLDLALTVMRRGAVVLHAPGLCHLSHLLTDARLARVPINVIIVRRALPDIIKSCERINWNDRDERAAYRGRPEFGPYMTDGAHVAQWKYEVLDCYQRPYAGRLVGTFYFQIAYEDLRAHPLWLPKEDRTDWEWDRTAPGKGGRNA